MTETRHLVIVGGGTAGWMTAASLAQALPRGSWAITLVESAEIGIIGVGEGSFPTLRGTVARLGQGLPGGDERSFMRAARATFKQGVRFVGWAGKPTPGSHADDYFHPFDLPRDNFDERLLPYWLDSSVDPRRPSWAGSLSVQEAVIHAGRAPKRAQDPDFAGPLNYAYHFDATSLAAWLRQMAQARGVKRIETTIASARLTEEGQIAAILPRDGSPEIAGDFFIDCSGLASMLIGEALGSPFVPVGDVLLNDRAVAMQIPDTEPGQPIAPYTQATAHEAGWIWDIALPDRRGTGCVYSSAHMSDDEAEATIRRYAGPAGDKLSTRRLQFRTGYRAKQWIGNCAAVGLAAGFFEPLESTGIMLIEVAAHLLGQMLAVPSDPAVMAASARSFNRTMEARFAAITDFLKLHYCISHRRDTPYWRDNTDPASWSDTLRDRIEQWRHRVPSRFDFVVDHESFLPPSWGYILNGMGFETQAGRGAIDADPAEAGKVLSAVAALHKAAPQAIATLPDHRALIDLIHKPR
ncbi:tryptophan halogenase family protein [Novosphingobium terrae]|uniref:tryptophan halogenase family protein n=1 Tax=Novosphingobium terrae TaxID=2726189 RepID=UPI00197FF152|nr:tryptophan halogenase family protein [Novosphingobium terrae]